VIIWLRRSRILQGKRDIRIWLRDIGGEIVLVTDLVPSEMACLASSPGRIRRTDVCISRDEIVDFFEYAASSEDMLDVTSMKK